MKKYEIMYILKADLDEEARKAEIEKLHGILTANGGEVTNVNEWGLREFAYPINDMLKGYYVVIKVTTDNEALSEFRRLGTINPNVVRHLITVDKDK
jgi:small subunit ribosomal protein S6